MLIATHDLAVDAFADEVARCPEAPLPRAEILGSRRADHRAALVEDAADVFRADFADRVAAVDQALEPFRDRVHVETGVDAVMIGRPFSIAAVGGLKDGVVEYIQQIHSELKAAMVLTGTEKAASVDRSIHRHQEVVSNPK